MIKGKYAATISIDFCVDEKTDGILPFEKLKKQVYEEMTSYIAHLLAKEFGDLGSIRVIKQYFDLYQTEGEK